MANGSGGGGGGAWPPDYDKDKYIIVRTKFPSGVVRWEMLDKVTRERVDHGWYNTNDLKDAFDPVDWLTRDMEPGQSKDGKKPKKPKEAQNNPPSRGNPPGGNPPVGGDPPGSDGSYTEKEVDEIVKKSMNQPSGARDDGDKSPYKGLVGGDPKDESASQQIDKTPPPAYEGSIYSETRTDATGLPYTLSVMPSGAVIQTNNYGNPYRVGWVPRGSTDLSLMRQGDYDKNPYVEGNPGYDPAGIQSGPDDSGDNTRISYRPFKDDDMDGKDDETRLTEAQYRQKYSSSVEKESEGFSLGELTGTKSDAEALNALKKDLTSDDKYGDRPKGDDWNLDGTENQGVTDPHKLENPESYPPPDTIFPDPEGSGGGTTKMM